MKEKVDTILKDDKITFQKITNENLELACEIQNTIFPEEDARENFIEQINNDLWNNKVLGLKEQGEKEKYNKK